MEKRGQVTLFIILGLVILAVVGIAYYLIAQTGVIHSLQEKYETQSLSSEAKNTASVFKSCLKRIGEEGILYVSARGGYYTAPSNSIRYGSGFVPLYYDQGIETMPKLSTIGTNIGKYIENHIDKCIFLLNTNKLKITKSNKVEVEVQFKGNIVEFYLNMPIKIQASNFESKVSIFKANTKSDLNQAYTNSIKIYKEQNVSSLNTNLVNLGVFALNNDIKFNVALIDSAIVFITTYNKTQHLNSDLKFNFGIRKSVKINSTEYVVTNFISEKNLLFGEGKTTSTENAQAIVSIEDVEKSNNLTFDEEIINDLEFYKGFGDKK